MNSVLTVVCPECQVIYRIDPSRVPPGGLRARCTSCGAVIAIGLAMPPFVASAAPMDPAVVAASDAAAAPVRTDAWDWGAAEPGSGATSMPRTSADDPWDWGSSGRSTGAGSVPPTSVDDPWVGLWGTSDPSAPLPESPRSPSAVDADPARSPAPTRPLPPAIARRPRS